ncbi:hypothetical protein THAOC_09720, partial [Thalassiosira oceanica]
MPKRSSSSSSSEADGLHARKKAKLSKTPTGAALNLDAPVKRPSAKRSAVAVEKSAT